MRTVAAQATPASIAVFDALTFEAPYVVERLVKDRVVGSVAEGEELFNEAKKYIVLSEVHRDLVVGMYSVRVDEAWHSFILYTDQYREFCKSTSASTSGMPRRTRRKLTITITITSIARI
jgi:hypothetical protein